MLSSEKLFLNQTRRTLFNTTAPRYDSLIMPVFGLLVKRLIHLAELHHDDNVIDLGTGTGAVAMSAAQIVHSVIGVDDASAMLAHSRKNAIEAQVHDRIIFCQGDLYHLPHPANSFDVAIASFGFNGIDPVQVFPEVHRVLCANGRLIFQEWGTLDEASKIIKKVFKRYQVKEAEGFLADLRCLGATPKAWDQLGSATHIAKALRQAGFRDVKAIIEHEAIPIKPEAFFKYRTAWAPYQAELSAMTPLDRESLETEVINLLDELRDTNNQFIWQPELLRMIAIK